MVRPNNASLRTDRGEWSNQLQKFKGHLNAWIKALAGDGDLPSDPEQLRLRKAVLILLSGTYTILGVFWGVAYLSLDRPLAGSFPLGYSVISAASIFYYFLSKRFQFFYRIQLFLILMLPFLLQWSLGGFLQSYPPKRCAGCRRSFESRFHGSGSIPVRQ